MIRKRRYRHVEALYKHWVTHKATDMPCNVCNGHIWHTRHLLRSRGHTTEGNLQNFAVGIDCDVAAQVTMNIGGERRGELPLEGKSPRKAAAGRVHILLNGRGGTIELLMGLGYSLSASEKLMFQELELLFDNIHKCGLQPAFHLIVRTTDERAHVNHVVIQDLRDALIHLAEVLVAHGVDLGRARQAHSATGLGAVTGLAENLHDLCATACN